MLGGHTVNRLEDQLFSSTSQMIVDLVYELYNRNPKAARFVTSNNMALSREQFWELGGFDLSFYRGASEDRELCARWLASGRRIAYEPTLKVFHAHHLGFSGFTRQHFNYGRGAWSFRAKQRKNRQVKDELDLHLDVRRWLLYPVRNKAPKPVRTMLAMLWWQVVNAAGFVYQGLAGRPK